MQKRRRNNALSFSVIDLNENWNRKLNSSYSIFKRRFCLFWWVVPEQNCPFFWIAFHECRIELQSVFIRNRRVSHCWKLSPIFDVTVILLLYFILYLLQNIQNLWRRLTVLCYPFIAIASANKLEENKY